MNPNDVAFSVIKNKRAMKQAAAQPGQMNLTQPSPQTNLDGESAGLQSEVSQYIQRLEEKQKELKQQEKDRAKYEEERAGMMQPGQQSLPQPQALPQPDQDIQQVVNDNQQELDTGYGFKRGLIEEMEMLGMIQKEDMDKMGVYIGDAESRADKRGFRTHHGEMRDGDIEDHFRDTRNQNRFRGVGQDRDRWVFNERGKLKFNHTAAEEGGYKDRPELTEIEPGDYMQGGSVPRRQPADKEERMKHPLWGEQQPQTGTYIGADVRGMDDSDESIDRFSNTMGHEYTHEAIDGEINDWLDENHGPEEEEVKLNYPVLDDDDDDDFVNNSPSAIRELLQSLGPAMDKTKPPLNQKEHDESKERRKRRDQIRTFAHEFGAHQSDQNSREGVAEYLSQRSDTKDRFKDLAKKPKNQRQTEQENRLRVEGYGPRYTSMSRAMTPQTQQQAAARGDSRAMLPLSQRMTPQTQQQSQQQVAQRLQEIQGKEMPIQTGEPMDIAMRLLKEAVSPEAKKHKHDYDTKYESSPERRKYRTELTQERRNRGVAGKGGKDMSHTARGTIVPEDMHANRARHFKERGTLKKTVFVKAQKCPTPSKKAYSDEEEAYQDASLMGYGVYPCPCGAYHFTSS